jgi:hypothetical protein
MIMAPGNENSYSIFQIHTGDAQSPTFGSTTFMIFWFTNSGGSIRYYSGTVLATNLADKWFQLNVDHNLATHTVRAWVDKKLVYTGQDNGATDFYMKDGVYEQKHGPTLQMDTYLTNILMWTSSGTNPPAGPAGLTATPTNAQIKLSWNDSVGATNYNVKRALASGGPYTNILTTTAATNYTDASVTLGPTYYYVVSAVDSFGQSTNSAPASASLGPPPHPVIAAPLLQGTNLVLSGTGGLPNTPYHVLTSTNLALPTAQWTPVGTDSFASNGTFKFTNTQDPNSPQLYYLLQTQ